jgi:DNA repair exonuclease SbcCD ATPase subunit
MSTTFAQSNYEKMASKLSSIEKRTESIQRQIEVQLAAYALVPKGIDTNATIVYYSKERERVCKRRELDITSIDNQIKALEVKKKALEDKFNTEDERYTSEIERVRQKLEDPEPPTTAYRKLKADLAKCHTDEEEAREQFREACEQCAVENEKRQRNAVREAEEKYRQFVAEEARKDEMERERIESEAAQKQYKEMQSFEEAVKRAEEIRAGKRPIPQVENISLVYKSPPKTKKGKQQKLNELSPHVAYSVADLDTINIDFDNDDPKKVELWEKLRAEACIAEKLPGNAVMRATADS